MSITKTRQKLVEVARELFARKGLEATTMNDIAANSGKGRRTLYTYFRNKEEIYAAVIETELERLSERIDEVASIEAEPEQKVLTLIYTHLSVIKEVVTRNGSLRAEFFRNIWLVEKCAANLTRRNATSCVACWKKVSPAPSFALTTSISWRTSFTIA